MPQHTKPELLCRRASKALARSYTPAEIRTSCWGAKGGGTANEAHLLSLAWRSIHDVHYPKKPHHAVLRYEFQILNCDPLNYLLNVLLRPDHPYILHAHPQPVINPPPPASIETSPTPEPFHLPVPLLRLAPYKNALTSLVPLTTETNDSCDHILTGVGGTTDSAEEFVEAYINYLQTTGGDLHPRFAHDIDAENFVKADPQYSLTPSPLPAPGGVRFTVPWCPRAHRGEGERYVLQPTLLSTRAPVRTDGEKPDAGLTTAEDERVESGTRAEDVQDLTLKVFGPFGDRDNCRAVERWAAWDMICVVELNDLFSMEHPERRWDLVKRYRQVMATTLHAAVDTMPC
ncbi:hypothetical protein BDV12DRAFT_195806 [Aspergillus spectabilis]